jgi:hypothetical protein
MEGLVELLRSLSGHSLKMAKRLTAYRNLLSDPVNNAHERSRALADIYRLAQTFPDSEAKRRVEEWHKDELASVEQGRSEFRFEFGRQFVAGLDGSGMAVKGQLPLLRVGLFTVRVDFDAGSATVFWGPEIERLKAGLKLAPAGLARMLRAYNDRLKQKSVEPEKLARQLHTAYRRICLLNNLNEGTRVFLLDLLAELVLLLQPEGFKLNPAQEKFVEYPRIRFSYDLFRLKQAGVFEVGGDRMKLHVANFDATTEKAKALWVPDNEEGDGTHYSYISLSKGA